MTDTKDNGIVTGQIKETCFLSQASRSYSSHLDGEPTKDGKLKESEMERNYIYERPRCKTKASGFAT